MSKPGVKEAYDQLEDDFLFLDKVLKARAESALTQAQA